MNKLHAYPLNDVNLVFVFKLFSTAMYSGKKCICHIIYYHELGNSDFLPKNMAALH